MPSFTKLLAVLVYSDQIINYKDYNRIKGFWLRVTLNMYTDPLSIYR